MAFVSLAKSDQVKVGSILIIKTRFCEVALTQIGDEILAFEDQCTHDGAEISCGKLEGEVITCPRHFAKFNVRTGKVLAKPATEPLTIYPVRIINGNVEVDLGD